MWMSMVGDGHDIFCGCEKPFAHMLDSIFPEGHTDRDLTIRQIIQRDLQCHSGGEEGISDGMALGTSAANLALQTEEEKEDQDTKEDIEELLAAAAAVEER